MSERWSNTTNRRAWRIQRSRILRRDNYQCKIKGPNCTGLATEADHLVPWVPGAIVLDSQLQAACRTCNSSAGSPEKRNPPVNRPAWLG